MVVQIFYTVEHILLQYHRAEIYIYIFCYIAYVIKLILQGFFIIVIYFSNLCNQSYQSPSVSTILWAAIHC